MTQPTTAPNLTPAATPKAVPGPSAEPVGVGFIGAGMISDTYLDHLTRFPDVRVVIVGDREPDRARARAEKHGVPQWGTADDVLAHRDVELVVNLTIPAVHAEVSAAAVAAGKHVWSEKPIGTDRASAQRLLLDAAAAGLLVGVAPDTVLGPGLQSALRAIAAGAIGVPLAAQTTIQYPGPDLFHPAPEFLFAPGAGPLYDVGPYFLTALVHLFGPIAHVAAVGVTGRPTRTIQVGDRAGTEFPVTVPTHVSAVAQFSGGATAQSLFSFDSALSRPGVVEITGTEGTMIIPDPNSFTGDAKITRPATALEKLGQDPTWEALAPDGVVAGRGIGALEMARCIRNGGQPIASGALGYHVLDTLIAMDESISTGKAVDVVSTVDPVPLLDEAWNPYQSTLHTHV